MSVRIHPTAIIEDDVTLGEGTSVWDNAHIRHGARLGEQCIVGGKSLIAYDVRDRQSREDQLAGLHLQRRDDRRRRDDQRRRDFHERSLSAGGDERPYSSCAPRHPTSTRCRRWFAKGRRSAPGRSSAAT